MTYNCYVCLKAAELSPRSRCVKCEYDRSKANEEENELLRMEVEALKADLQKAQADL